MTANEGNIESNKQAIQNNSNNITKLGDRVTNVEGDVVNLDKRVTNNSKAIEANKQEIAAVDKRHSIVEQGKNIKVTSRKGNNGETVYNVATSDDLEANSVTINNGPTINQNGINANNTKVTNVKEGVADTDAVNVAQLNRVKDTVKDNAAGIAKVNKRVDGIERDVKKNRKRADAGTAAVAAMANIPQVMSGGKSGVGVGVGYKRSQSALAVGYSRASDNAHHIIKLSAGVDTQKDVTLGAGYLYQW